MPWPSLARLTRVSDSPLFVAGLVFFLYAAVLLGRLSRHDFDPTFFVTAGDAYADTLNLPVGFSVIKDSEGYDGQFYYRMSVSPFSTAPEVGGILFDAPAYRQQRFLYPLLSWIVSFGREEWAAWSMIMVNFVGMCVLGFLGAKYFKQKGIHALWSLALPLYGGFVLTIARDLTEIVAAVFLVASLMKMDAGKWRQGALLLSLAVLAKETTVGVSCAAGLLLFLRLFRNERVSRDEWVVFVLPVGVFLLNQIIWYNVWGRLPVTTGQGLGIPFYGFVSFVWETFQFRTHRHFLWLGEIIVLLMVLGAAGFSFSTSNASRLEKAGWLSYLALAVTVSDQVWIEDWAFMRAIFELALFSAVLALKSGKMKTRILFLLPTLFLWSVLAARVQR